MNTQFTKILSHSTLPDYRFLSSKEALENYEAVLTKELKKLTQFFLEFIKQDVKHFEDIEVFLSSDRDLHVLYTFLHNLNSTDSSEKTREIIEKIQPKYVDYVNLISLSPELYKKLKHTSCSTLDQKRSLELLLRGMEISGVHLEGEKKSRLESINKELSELSEKFSNNTIDSRKQFFFHFETDADIQEMPEQEQEEAKNEALERKLSGFVFTLSPPSYQAIMKYCSNRNVREMFYKAYNKIASEGDFDNRPIALKTLQLRQEKSELLGKKHYAEYILQDRMAESPEEVEKIVFDVLEKSRKKAEEDIAELKSFSKLSDFQLWDSAYFAEKLMKEKFSLDDKELKKYFPLDSVLSGLFTIVQKLYNVEMKKLEVTSYSSDVQTFEVWRNSEKIAYFLLDLFARKSKRGGAWCNDLRQRQKCGETVEIPVVINVCNFGKSTNTEPTLLTHYDVETIFHEFGHALHVMLGENEYGNLSGFHTEWDFVELPSQILENWCWETESLSLFAKHFQTGESIPQNMIDSLKKSKTFMSGNFVLRQNEQAILDMELHSKPLPKTTEELDARCFEIAQKYAVLPKPDDFKMYTAFSHIFAGGYAYGYYSYLWAEILEADAFQEFQKAGVLSPVIGEKFRKTVLSQGTRKPAKELFKNFMGRDADISAYLKKQGLI